ncbi:MAG: PTS sugar transporter subunit IIA [Nevskiales bacterium]
MKIAELLNAERVQLRTDLRSKKRVLEDMGKLLSLGAPGLDESDIFSTLIGREKLGSTGMGFGVAIPHGRMQGLERAVGAFMKLSPGVDYESSDGTPADLIFGLLVPEQATEQHLLILRRLAEMFTDDTFCAELRAAADGAALFALLNRYAPAPEPA